MPDAIRVTALLAFLVGAAACSTPSATPSVESRFQGQIVQIVVGRTAGGTYDLYARAMAQYFSRHIPGHPTVVVQNMAGAGGLLALKYVAHQARPDGLTIGLVGLPGIMAQVTDDREAQQDASRLRAIGSAADDVPVCVSSQASRLDLDTWRGRQRRPRFGVTSYGTPSHMNTTLMTTALHLPVQMIVGYKGTAEIRQAMASREVDGACVGVDAYLSTFEPKDDYRVVLQLGGEESNLELVPALSSLVTDESDRDLVGFIRLMGRIARYYAVPSNTPDDIVSALRRAFDDTMHDPDFLEAAQRAHLPVSPRSGNQIEESVRELVNIPATVRQRVEAIVKDPAS